MAHVGEELALRAVRALGGLLRGAQGVLVGLALPDQVVEQAGEREQVAGVFVRGLVREVERADGGVEFLQHGLVAGVLGLKLLDGGAELVGAEAHRAAHQAAVNVLLLVGVVDGMEERGQAGIGGKFRPEELADLPLQKPVAEGHASANAVMVMVWLCSRQPASRPAGASSP